MNPDVPREKRTHAQYRTLDALEGGDGILLYLDKGGTLLHLKQPRMDCYAIRVVRADRLVVAVSSEVS